MDHMVAAYAIFHGFGPVAGSVRLVGIGPGATMTD